MLKSDHWQMVQIYLPWWSLQTMYLFHSNRIDQHFLEAFCSFSVNLRRQSSTRTSNWVLGRLLLQYRDIGTRHCEARKEAAPFLGISRTLDYGNNRTIIKSNIIKMNEWNMIFASLVEQCYDCARPLHIRAPSPYQLCHPQLSRVRPLAATRDRIGPASHVGDFWREINEAEIGRGY